MLLLDDWVCTLFLVDDELDDSSLLAVLDWLLLDSVPFELIGTVTFVVAGQITTFKV